MKKEFIGWLFDGMNARDKSNKYITADRCNEDETKIIVKVGSSHILETRYGFALILDYSHVVFVKSWAVSRNFYGNEVMLSKDYFNVKEWGEHYDFGEIPENLEWDYWVSAAKEQSLVNEDGDPINPVLWAKDGGFDRESRYGFR